MNPAIAVLGTGRMGSALLPGPTVIGQPACTFCIPDLVCKLFQKQASELTLP